MTCPKFSKDIAHFLSYIDIAQYVSINYRGVGQFLKLYNLVYSLKTFCLTSLQHFCVLQYMFRDLCGYHVVSTWSNPRGKVHMDTMWSNPSGKVHVATTWIPRGFLNKYHVACTTY